MIEKIGNAFKNGTVPSGPTKGNYVFDLKFNPKFKDEELKKQSTELFKKIFNAADTLFDNLKSQD